MPRVLGLSPARSQPLWLLPGIGSLVVFALLPSRIEMDFAQRAYAAYGDVQIVSSLVWL